MATLSPLNRAQVHNTLRRIEGKLSPAVKKLAEQLLGLLEEDGSASIGAVHEALFPLADRASASAQLSTLAKKMVEAASKEGLTLKLTYSGSKKGGVGKRRLYFSSPRTTPVADTEGLDAIDPASRISGQLTVPLDAPIILLLTYNENEFAAVRATFWHGSNEPDQRGSGETIVDDLGNLNGWSILHGHSRQGNREAQLSVEKLRQAHAPYAIISVGIAFGVNEAKQSIGDVLISKFIVDYELGRVGPSGIVLRGARPPASRRLVHGLEQLDIRSKKRTGWPRLIFGGVLSGEKLVDDHDYRDKLLEIANQDDIVGGEMEAVGLCTALDDTGVAWVVVKAICDFADGNKNNPRKQEYQQVAAQNSAVVVYALLTSSMLKQPLVSGISDSASGNEQLSAKTRQRLKHDHEALGCSHPFVQGQCTGPISLENIQDEELTPNKSQTIAFDHLLQWLENKDAPPLYALLGEYGMGKTTHCQALTRHLEEMREKGASLPAPLYFDLRKVEHIATAQNGSPGHVATLQETVEDCLRNGYLQTSGQAFTYQDVVDVIDDGAVVIFDGLDEVLSRITDSQGLKFTANLLKVLPEARVRQTGKGLEQDRQQLPKVLLSCRTQFFRNLAEQNSHLTGEHRGGQPAKQYQASVLLPFTDDQIKSYLKAVVANQDVDKLMSLIASVHNLRELASRPFTLKLVAQFVPRIQSWHQQGRIITGATLYREVAREWLLRDKEKQTFQPEDKERLAGDLAAHLWRTGKRGLPARELEQWLDAWLSHLPAYATVLQKPRELLHQDLRNATFLKRSDAEKPENSRFEFAHTSLQEFFLADYLFRALEANADAPDESSGQRSNWVMPVPSTETLDFLGQILAESGSQNPALKTLSSWRSPYLALASELQLAYAIRAYQRHWPQPITAGSDLQGADLSEWHFGSVSEPEVSMALDYGTSEPPFDLSASNFSNARIRRARFWQVRLNDADFSNAALSQTEFLQCKLDRTVWSAAETGGLILRPNPIQNDSIGCIDPTNPPSLEGNEKVRDLLLAAGHNSDVTCCAFSPDGMQLLSGAWDNTLKLWDTVSGECLRSYIGHEGPVTSCAFSPDGMQLLSGAWDKTLKLWDTASGECLRSYTGHEDWVTSCAFSPDGKQLLSGARDNTLKLWETASGECLRSYTGHEGPVTSCAFSPDGMQLLSGAGDNTLKLWETASGECLRSYTGHEDWVTSCAFSADGKQLLSGAVDNSLKLWDTASGECLRSYTGHEGRVTSCAFSPDGMQLLSGAWDKTLKLWDTASGECLRSYTGHEGRVTSCAFSADGKQLLSGAWDNTLKLWDTASGECLRSYTGHEGWVTSCEFSADGMQLLSGAWDNTLKLWDTASGECLRSYTGHEGPVTSCAFSPDGMQLLSGAWDNTLKLWDTASGECLRSYTGHEDSVTSCAFSPDGMQLLSGAVDNSLKLWDTASGECLRSYTGHEGRVTSCAFSPDGMQLLSGTSDNTLKLWDTASGECLRSYTGHEGSVTSCAFSPDGMQLLSSAWDNTLKLWDTASGECLRSYTGHEGWVSSCAFSPDGMQLLSSARDNTLKLWDTASGECLRSYTGHEGLVTSCAFSPDGMQLLSGAWDNTLKLWNTASGECLRSYLGLVRGSAAWEPGSNKLLHIRGRAWRYLRWREQDASGNTRVYPIDSVPGVTLLPWASGDSAAEAGVGPK